MRVTDNVFDWKNVPRALLVLAVIITAITCWGAIQPSVFGSQPLMLPFAIIATAVFWFFVYWTGTSKTQVKAAEEPIRPEPQKPEVMPEFEEYMAAEKWMEEHPNAIPPAMPPKKGSHKYDARV